ncbi:MAG TPA: DUF3604 domain-containing protein, partial [Myxococcota bacterium]|nr:DUF3604 domain-containing protein [Myxococcota bacterium]
MIERHASARFATLVLIASITATSLCGSARESQAREVDSGTSETGESYSPYVDRDHPTRVFWGDTHVHTSWSPDAAAGGNARIGPDEAYR